MGTPTREAPGARRIDPPDEQQIRLIMSVPPEQRIRNLLRMQATVLGIWRQRLRAAHPELTDLELTRLVFERLGRNG